MTTWATLTAAEPRLQQILDAARDLVGATPDMHAEAVYALTKPLVAWLTGPDRGNPPRRGARTAPPGSRLWAMTTVARPFTPAPSWLDDHHTHDHACGHINEFLHRVQSSRGAA